MDRIGYTFLKILFMIWFIFILVFVLFRKTMNIRIFFVWIKHITNRIKIYRYFAHPYYSTNHYLHTQRSTICTIPSRFSRHAIYWYMQAWTCTVQIRTLCLLRIWKARILDKDMFCTIRQSTEHNTQKS